MAVRLPYFDRRIRLKNCAFRSVNGNRIRYTILRRDTVYYGVVYDHRLHSLVKDPNSTVAYGVILYHIRDVLLKWKNTVCKWLYTLNYGHLSREKWYLQTMHRIKVQYDIMCNGCFKTNPCVLHSPLVYVPSLRHLLKLLHTATISILFTPYYKNIPESLFTWTFLICPIVALL